jgi:ADP-heptose:LPS heptosyltransferase
MPQRILIFRTGSLGDTVVALPAFHLIARAFPDSHRTILANLPVGIGKKEAPIASVLAASGLVDEFISYDVHTRSIRDLLALASRIRALKFDAVVYLMPQRNLRSLVRDRLFFGLGGISRVIGLNYGSNYHAHLKLPGEDRFESEASRLLRNLSAIGAADIDDPAMWDLGLNSEEREQVRAMIRGWRGSGRFIAASVGTKVDTNHWGIDRWQHWAAAQSTPDPEIGLVLIGAPDEIQESASIAQCWNGPVLNLCGKLTPRQSAALLEMARIYVGHDSGPMHLAAAVGVPCVAIFSARWQPGIWFPRGNEHRVLYRKTPCCGCKRTTCEEFDKMCIRAITVDDVVAATRELMIRGGGVESVEAA